MARLSVASSITMLNALFTGTQYVGLFTADPGIVGTSGECTSGTNAGYARIAITWTSATTATISNATGGTCTMTAGTPPDVQYIGIFSAATGTADYIAGGTAGPVTALVISIAIGAITATVS